MELQTSSHAGEWWWHLPPRTSSPVGKQQRRPNLLPCGPTAGTLGFPPPQAKTGCGGEVKHRQRRGHDEPTPLTYAVEPPTSKIQSDRSVFISADDMWLNMATYVQKVASEVFGVSRRGKQEGKDTWWWNDAVQRAIKEKKE